MVMFSVYCLSSIEDNRVILMLALMTPVKFAIAYESAATSEVSILTDGNV